MACNVQRSIDSAYFTDILRIRGMMKKLPEEARVCSECGKEVEITESEFISNPGDASPFTKRVLNAPLLAAGMDEPSCAGVRCPRAR